jgi:hypothetical protein
VTAGSPDRGSNQAPDLGEKPGVSLAESREHLGRAFDVRQQEGHIASRQLPLRFELGADEPDGHDPVLLCRPQQPKARPVPRGVVLERDLIEARKRIPYVSRVVDRQAPCAAGIDVRKSAVGKLSPLLRTERWHVAIIADSRSPASG